MRAGTVLFLLVTGAIAADLDVALRNVRRQTAYRLMKLARRAEEAGLLRTAVDIRERVLDPCPDHPVARARLGYEGRKGRWTRSAQSRAALLRLEDSDEDLAEQYRKEAKLLEEHLSREVVRVCGKYGDSAQKRKVLLPLLAREPRRADVHEALGHEKIGEDYVRPELLAMVRSMPGRVKAWRQCAAASVEPAPAGLATLPGLEETLPMHRVGRREVAASLEPEAAIEIACAVGRARIFLQRLLGPDAAGAWDPRRVVFLDAKSYARMLRALHPDEDSYKLYATYGNYEHPGFYAIRVWSAAGAAERYAHGAGYLTMLALAAPPSREAEGSMDPRGYAWLNEGFGYLCGFELFGTGNLSFVSLEESSAKRKYAQPPKSKTRATCLAWTREQLIAGHGHRLRDVCARSLNNLDFLASMEAYTFLRFLFLFDPAAARRLPAALAARTDGPQVERADGALRETFGKGLDEFEPLWRAFVLEITQE